MALIDAVVTGSLLFSDEIPHAPGMVAHILVEEVSRADALATLVASLAIPGSAVRTGCHPVPFSVQVEAIDPAKSYIVRVHVDVDGDGLISPGDHISTESYPVVTQGAANQVQVRVRRV